MFAAEHVTGTLHVGGQEHLSRYDFGMKLCEMLGYDRSQIKKVKIADVPMAAKRVAKGTYNTHKLNSLGFIPELVSTRLAEFK